MRLSFQYICLSLHRKWHHWGLWCFKFLTFLLLGKPSSLRWERSNLFQCNTNNCMTNALVFLCPIFSYHLPKNQHPLFSYVHCQLLFFLDRDIFYGIYTFSVGIFGNYFLQYKFANSNSCSSLRTKTKNLWLRLMMRCSSFLTALNAKFHKYFIPVENFIRH